MFIPYLIVKLFDIFFPTFILAYCASIAMRKFAFIIFLSVGCLVASIQHSHAQTDPNAGSGEPNTQQPVVKKKGKKGQTQEDLDAINKNATGDQMSPEQKAYLKKMAKTKKEKEKRSAVNRKQADKIAQKRLNSAKSKTTKKKKNYVKSHNKSKKK